MHVFDPTDCHEGFQRVGIEYKMERLGFQLETPPGQNKVQDFWDVLARMIN